MKIVHTENDSVRNNKEYQKSDLHEDLWVTFIGTVYFPTLAKYPKLVCSLWFIIFIICTIFGTRFLGNTRSNLDLPAGTPSADAIAAFQKNYKDASSWPSIFIVQYDPSGQIVKKMNN